MLVSMTSGHVYLEDQRYYMDSLSSSSSPLSKQDCRENVAAMQVVYDGLRSPTEFESTPVIAQVLQEYFLRLLGWYREFVQPEGTPRQPSAAPDDLNGPSLQRNSMSGRDGEIRARPSFKQSPKAAVPSGRNAAAADDDGYLR